MSSRRHDHRDPMTAAELVAQEEVRAIALPTEDDVQAALAALAEPLWGDESLGYDCPEGIFEDFDELLPDWDDSDEYYPPWLMAQEADEDYWRQYEADRAAEAEPKETDRDYDLQVAGLDLDLIPQVFLRAHRGLEEDF